MGFDLVQMLGLGKKSPNVPEITTPLGPSTIGTTPIGKQTLDQVIKAQMQGFGPSFVSKATSPLATQLRSSLQEETIPAISEAASARGLGRSTAVVRDIGKAEAQTGRDINQVLANAIVENERAKERARQLGFAVSTGEAGLQADVAREQTKRAEDMRALGLGAEHSRQAQDAQTLNKLIASAVAVGTAGATGGASLAGLPGIIGGAQGMQASEALKFALQAQRARPFVGRGGEGALKGASGRTTSSGLEDLISGLG